MMAENKPSFNLLTKISTGPVKQLPIIADGCVGVGTWQTQTEYKDFKVTTADGRICKPVSGDWLKLRDEWGMTDGVVAQKSNNNLTGLIWNRPFTGDYTFELQARKTGGTEGFLIYFGMSDQNREGYLFNLGGWANTLTGLETIRNGTDAALVSEQIPQTIDTDKWYDIKIVKSARTVALWVNGSLQISYTPTSTPGQFAVGGYDEKSGEVIIKVVNAEETPWRSSVRIVNAAEIQSGGIVIALSSKSLEDENSFAEPLKISPVMNTFNGFSPDFQYTFAPCSFTVLRIKVARR
jgi:alpha-L-arabinofuranosidase